MPKALVLFGYDKPNRYTWSILMGYLESDPVLMDQYSFHPLPFHLYKSHLHQAYFEKIDFKKYDYVILAYSLLSVQIPQFEEFNINHNNFFNKFHPKIITIVGGSHVAASPEDFARFKIDFIIPDEGEYAFSQLLHVLIGTSKEKIETQLISGLSRGFPIYIPANQPKLIEVGKYPPFSAKFRLFGPIEISRGCPFRCKFCQTGNRANKMRHASVENIVKWVRMASEIKFDKVWFLSPNSFGYGSRNGVTPDINALFDLLSQIHAIPAIKGIYFGTFPSEVRPESVTYEVLETVAPFLSNKKILIGAQSASNRLLRSVQRGHTFEQVKKAILLLNEFKFNIELDFIFGFPGENKEDIKENLNFFNEILEGKYKNVKIHTHTFMPLPGTPFSNEPKGILDPSILKIIGKLSKIGKAYGEHLSQAGKVKTRYSKK
ncbi:TIGR04013 family B12-binding domain/radical SAM domain-containing protein [Promethearchaeum syntrophicum]|uniref:TIGR04013 family B12-binding domain/radical SAM domain-containing protein n=1 Tax=Promethearchaeum syntrophicum TaxID=2594042 RepID=A0A5B9D6A1_9ARCH|nr:TIGR04013 family B12-binding domain/radical SAM domain-containing protein [Candidatus Prometheoarchaeum syntrophicum]QEE14668.1 coproporphyrinogen III oxidase [Candidatus Prometheoarchaeum syntrophicum]